MTSSVAVLRWAGDLSTVHAASRAGVAGLHPAPTKGQSGTWWLDESAAYWSRECQMECSFNCFVHYFELFFFSQENTEFLGQNVFDTPS